MKTWVMTRVGHITNKGHFTNGLIITEGHTMYYEGHTMYYNWGHIINGSKHTEGSHITNGVKVI